MKTEIHRSGERGIIDHGWLLTRHSFSFAEYYNPERMGFGALRVINEDTIKPGRGFQAHSHKDMEIVTIVLSGSLEHKDSTGGSGVIRPGEVQRMSAGRGVTHSEFNHSKTEPLHLLQIWIDTKEPGIAPDYEQKSIRSSRNELSSIVSNDGMDSLRIHQDASMHIGRLGENKSVTHTVAKNRGVYAFLINGSAKIGSDMLEAGDAAAITGAKKVDITALKDSHILLIEVPMSKSM